jgi:hypothetical protein
MRVIGSEPKGWGMRLSQNSRYLSLLVLLALFMGNCRGDHNGSRVRSELIDGIQHVYNTGEPLKGRVSLEVTEVLRIDPDEINLDNPPLFQTGVKDDTGNLYLADIQNIRVYKFDFNGKLLAQFLAQGQGPGEFPRFGDLQIAGNHAWIIGNWPLKIAKFTLDGQFINEWMFPSFRNFYLQTQVITEDKFLTVSYQEGTEGQDRRRVSALINSDEEFLTLYYEDKNTGIFRIRTGEREGPAIASTNPLVAADIHHAYDHHSGVVYVCNNREYKIQSKNPDGTTRMVIHKDHQNVILDEDKKESILQLIAPQLPMEARRQAKEQLPDTLNAIWGMSILPNGHLAVKRITGVDSVEVDVFDGEGRLLYTILPSAEIPNLRNVTIYEKTIGVISESEDKTIYVEYKVKNIRGMFD